MAKRPTKAPVIRSFSRCPRLHFPVDISRAQHHAQAPKIAHTFPHLTDHSQLRLFSCRICGSTSHSLWLALSFDSGLLWEATKSFFFENHFKEKLPGRMYTTFLVRDVHASRSLSCVKFSNNTDKLPTFRSKSDFSQVKRYCNPHLFW